MQGYILGTVFAAVELWWLSIVLVLLIEVGHHHHHQRCTHIVVLVLLVVTIIIGVLHQVGLVLYMRDSLVLMAVTFVVRSEKVRKSSP